MSKRYCTTCKWLGSIGFADNRCFRPTAPTGLPKKSFCELERFKTWFPGSHCGPEGKYWEAKDAK